MLREAVAISRSAQGSSQPARARVTRRWAEILDQMGQLDQAESAYRDALRTACWAFGDQHADTAPFRDALCDFLARRGRPTADPADSGSQTAPAPPVSATVDR